MKYNPFAGVLFNEKHSYRDWGMYLKTRPVISPPKPKTVYVNLPEADGQIDLTQALTGEVAFESRTITCTFTVLDARERWPFLYSEIMDYLHGENIKVVFDDDPSYYYEGRFQVDQWQSNKMSSTLVITGIVDPYKMERSSSLNDWLWDPFCFETDVVRNWLDIRIDGNLTMAVVGGRKSVVPTFTVSLDNANNPIKLTIEKKNYQLVNGKNRNPNIVIREGKQNLIFNGHGTVSIDYRGGRL